MKKYKIVFTFLFILLYLLWYYLSYSSLRKSREAYIADVNITVIDIADRVKVDIHRVYDSNFKLWDLEINKILEDREKKREKDASQTIQKESSSQKGSRFNLTKRKICLQKRCWEFMGMLTIGKKVEVTLLSTDKKRKLGTFSVGDELLEGLIIRKIKGDRMVVLDKKKDKKFILKVFEVNATAYLPKKREGKDDK